MTVKWVIAGKKPSQNIEDSATTPERTKRNFFNKKEISYNDEITKIIILNPIGG